MPDHPIDPMDQGLSFGPFVLIPSRRLLLEDGEPVELGLRALDILTLLASRQGEIVSKETLLTEAWPDVFVEEVNLRVHVSAVRRALGDGVGGRRYLKTIPGQGYSFVQPVAVLGTPVAGAKAAWLPRQARRVVGRDVVIAALVEDLERERLVTVVGPAGIGKTTVAVAAADRAQAEYPDGGAFVDLAPVNDPAAVPSAVAMALGLTQVRASGAEAVAQAIGARRILLVIDNCEHLIGAVADVVQALLVRAPNAQVLATSREPLGLADEKLRRLEPLDVPDPMAIRTIGQARANPAIQLFEQRAQTVRDSFELDDDNAPVVAGICRHLDGVPFAIELAASRVDAFGLSELKAQLDDRASLLGYGVARAAPRHQRSVRDALAWSHDLLSAPERVLLRRLSVFAGAFALEDAVDLAAWGETPPRQVVDGIAALAAKSLLSVEFRGLDARYRLLETTRLFAAERLDQDDTADIWRRRHAELVQARLDRDEPPAPVGGALRPPAAVQYLDDLRAALDWAFAAPAETDTAANLTLAAVPLWTQLSLHAECRRRTETALSRLNGPGEERYRDMRLRAALGSAIMYGEGHGPSAVAALSEALAAARRFGDVEHELRALWALWSCAVNMGSYAQGLEFARQFAQAAERSPLSDDGVIADRLLGFCHHYLAEPMLARRHTEAFLARYIPPADGRDIRRYHFEQRSMGYAILAPVLWTLGFPDQAQGVTDRTLGEARLLDHPLTLVYAALQSTFHAVVLAGNIEAAREGLGALAQLAERLPWSPAGPMHHLMTGSCEARLGDPAIGVPRLEAVVQARAASGSVLQQSSAMGVLAVGWRRLGDLDRAQSTIEAALSFSERHGERWCHAELLRINAQILQAAGEAAKAERLYEAAIQETRARAALGWELRAATGLAGLWIGSGRHEAARALLSETLGKFREGFATGDVRAAQALLSSSD
jgi:predicted ATPase/DNA-binding winged helix-turn-helix (wHTH) protein